jgi:hypothetical protein
MTIAQAIADPMIALLNEADRVAEGSFAQLLESAARVLNAPRVTAISNDPSY